MKNYSLKKAKKGKVAYRTPRKFIDLKWKEIKKIKSHYSKIKKPAVKAK